MADPIALFEQWFEEARAAGEPEPEGMTLATCDAAGRPSARIVLFRGLSEGGFRFFTNYHSRKGGELESPAPHGAHAALLFWFRTLTRQVRVEGPVEKLSAAESDAYFAARPRGHQLGAWASEQSQPIAGRAVLEARYAEATQRFEGRPVERPPHWGGYRVRPAVIELWRGREDRLHERQRFTRVGAGWHEELLSP